MFKTQDLTNNFTQEDMTKNMAMGILSYIGILVLIPLFARDKNSEYTKFCVNQGLKLCVASVALSIVSVVVGLVIGVLKALLDVFILDLLLTLIMAVVSLVLGAASIAVTVLMVIGLINVCTKKAKTLPLIDKIKFDFIK